MIDDFNKNIFYFKVFVLKIYFTCINYKFYKFYDKNNIFYKFYKFSDNDKNFYNFYKFYK